MKDWKPKEQPTRVFKSLDVGAGQPTSIGPGWCMNATLPADVDREYIESIREHVRQLQAWMRRFGATEMTVWAGED